MNDILICDRDDCENSFKIQCHFSYHSFCHGYNLIPIALVVAPSTFVLGVVLERV